MPPEELPSIGFGTYKLESGQCEESVQVALDAGYRHLDTAQGYGNEAAVGDGLAESSVDRDDVFVVTKVSTRNLAGDDVRETGRESAEKLGVETIDLLYVHWPIRTYDAAETLAAFDELVDDGVIRHVGLSNFTPEQLDEAGDLLDAPILAHQVEMHPFLPQEELHEYAIEHDHYLVAYCPIARGEVFDDETLTEIAGDHDATAAQVALAWLMAKDNVIPIPKATGADHIRENYGATTLDLTDEDIARIDGIEEERRLVDPDRAPWN